MAQRITLVMAGDEEGGLEKHVVELAAGLAERGHSVSLIAHEKYRNRLHPDVQFYAVNLAKSRRNPIVLFALWYAMRQTNPQVIHAHGNKAAAMVGPLLRYWRQFGALSVATLHARKKNIHMYAPFDRVIAVSDAAAAQLQHARVSVVLNGITPPLDCAPKTQNHPKRVLAVGRLVDVKGFDVLIDAWQDLPATLWIAGDGPLHDSLQAQITRHGLAERVTLLGHRHDIDLLMQHADLHVIASHDEGGPYTFAEALLAHTPVVSTRVGMPERYLPAQYLCAPNQPDALHQILRHALGDMAHTRLEFEPVFAWAAQHLTLSAMVQGVEAVYADLPPTTPQVRV